MDASRGSAGGGAVRHGMRTQMMAQEAIDRTLFTFSGRRAMDCRVYHGYSGKTRVGNQSELHLRAREIPRGGDPRLSGDMPSC